MAAEESQPVRRSKRDRKQSQSYYDDAERAEEEKQQQRSQTKRRRITSPLDDDEEEDEDRAARLDDDDTDSQKMSESEDDDNDDNDSEGDYTPKTASRAKRRTTTPASKTPKKAATTKKRVARFAAAAGDAKKPAKARAPARRGAAGSGATNKTRAALSALAKRVLDSSETEETSLLAALLLSSQPHPQTEAALRRSGFTRQNHMTPYTCGLVEAAQRLVEQHQDDPNRAQVSLYNLLFRSVGASHDALLDAADVDLESMDATDMMECIQTVVESMEETPVEQVLLLADPASGSSSVKGPAMAIREYHAIFREFWYRLGVTALSDGLAAAPPAKKKKRKSKKRKATDDDDSKGSSDTDKDSDSSSSDTEEEEENNKESQQSTQTLGLRFQIETVSEVLKRMVEYGCLFQEDLRAGTTVAVYELSVAILERTVELRDKIKVTKRQLSSAHRCNMKRKAEALQSQADGYTRMCAELEELVTETTMGLFMKRYKDTHAQIRAESMHAMTRFILIRPDTFFQNSHLKYLGWMLSDKSADVRCKAVEGMLAPIRHNHGEPYTAMHKPNKQKMDLTLLYGMADKFTPRLAECTMDVDVTVQELAMELLLAFSREGLLNNLDDESVWNRINGRALAVETSAAVRRDALLFVLEQLEAFDDGHNLSETDAVERINALATWITHCIAGNNVAFDKIPYNRVSYVIASLRACPQHQSLITNYSAMLRALQECGNDAASQSRRRLEAVQRRVLLEMLVASVEQEMPSVLEENNSSLEGVVDPAFLAAQRAETEAATSAVKGGRRRKKHGKDGGLQEKLTVAILGSLPKLMEAFKTETSLMRGLTTLPKYFLPSVLSTSSQKKHFSALLDQLSSLFLAATDKTVLFNCCLTLTLLAAGDHTRSSEALVVLKRDASALCEELMGLLEEKTALTDYKEILDLELSIGLALRRLVLVSKRWPLSELVTDGEDTVEKLCVAVFESVARDLEARKVEAGEGEPEVPVIWESAPEELHERVKESTVAALSFLLNSTMWPMRDQLALAPEEREHEHLVRARDRLTSLVCLCYEMYLEESEAEFEAHHREFAHTVQLHAMQVAGDLRGLFPREWVNSSNPFLRACALANEGKLIGGSVRFFQSQEEKLLSGGENVEAVRSLLLPFPRAITTYWQTANRREAATVFPHIVGSGSEASSLIGAMARTLKKTGAVRFLEAHMACFRGAFERWGESEPDPPESDRPTEEEIEDFEEAEKAHKEKFDLMEQQAKRLSSSLGVGRLSDRSLKPALLGFVREGIRFAFSTEPEQDGGENILLGARLAFLRILSKYMNWIRKDKRHVEEVRTIFNEKEAELRNHPDFGRVLEEDMEALGLFRQAGDLGAFLVEDDDEKASRDDDSSEAVSENKSGARRRLSHASSASSIPSRASSAKSNASKASTKSKASRASSKQSLPSLPEGEEKEEGGPADDEDKSHDGSSISSKSSKRSGLASVAEGSDEGSDN